MKKQDMAELKRLFGDNFVDLVVYGYFGNKRDPDEDPHTAVYRKARETLEGKLVVNEKVKAQYAALKETFGEEEVVKALSFTHRESFGSNDELFAAISAYSRLAHSINHQDDSLDKSDFKYKERDYPVFGNIATIVSAVARLCDENKEEAKLLVKNVLNNAKHPLATLIDDLHDSYQTMIENKYWCWNTCNLETFVRMAENGRIAPAYLLARNAGDISENLKPKEFGFVIDQLSRTYLGGNSQKVLALKSAEFIHGMGESGFRQLVSAMEHLFETGKNDSACYHLAFASEALFSLGRKNLMKVAELMHKYSPGDYHPRNIPLVDVSPEVIREFGVEGYKRALVTIVNGEGRPYHSGETPIIYSLPQIIREKGYDGIETALYMADDLSEKVWGWIKKHPDKYSFSGEDGKKSFVDALYELAQKADDKSKVSHTKYLSGSRERAVAKFKDGVTMVVTPSKSHTSTQDVDSIELYKEGSLRVRVKYGDSMGPDEIGMWADGTISPRQVIGYISEAQNGHYKPEERGFKRVIREAKVIVYRLQQDAIPMRENL